MERLQYIPWNMHMLGCGLLCCCHSLRWLRVHDDVIKWKHFPRYWPFMRGIHRSPVNSLHKGQWRGDLMFSLLCAWINGWANNREAGDLRRHRTHYDVIVMIIQTFLNDNFIGIWSNHTIVLRPVTSLKYFGLIDVCQICTGFELCCFLQQLGNDQFDRNFSRLLHGYGGNRNTAQC